MSCNRRNLLHVIIIIITFYVCFNCGCTEGAVKRGRVKESCSHTIQVSSLFPSSSSACIHSSKAFDTKSSLHVVHRHGPCSSLTSGKATTSLDHDNILRLDQARVDSIQSKLSKNQARPNQLTDLPVKQWVSDTLGPGTYVVQIGIGTPRHNLSLMFDTGSDLTWTQCKPCNGTCYTQKEPVFDPSLSSSYSIVSPLSPVCASLRDAGLSRSCSGSKCCYHTTYGDDSFSLGLLANEKFTLKNSTVFDRVNFGCGINSKGLYYGVAGLLGLGRGELSFPSQTTSTYNNIFSYCIPSSASYTGLLTFGSAGISKSVKFTPISIAPSLSTSYGLDIEGIAVCDKRLEIPSTVFSKPGALIDSGTVITRLPPKAYAALRSAFREKMSNYTTTSREKSEMDTCYDFTGLETVTIPKITFYFRGGAVVELDPKGVLYPAERSHVCLAFIGNRREDEVTIFGNVQQQTLQVVYDGAGRRVGFAPNGCN